ncbi:Nucleoporin [Penicillium taxi]|uniref:Nucleoporin n=1 Tax=Penicillium taxi TaxID=168475 RepID=UPI002545473D|nr:Nucleoporin [Penicillium taxi]KAJ5901955.1 Nucleoporin [Penicillium taxi]
MAPVPEAYFPSLDKCFSGDVQLLSWRRAFLYANDPDTHADDGGSVSAFLSHPESIQLLSQSLNPFSPPSAKSKSEFESRTAAINVETSKGSFDLNEIKEDAQWLSEKAKVDEITALRITILEWQNRPATRLTATFSSEEATSLQSATGVDNLRASVAGPLLANILKQAAGKNESSFDTEYSRRLRLRKLYLLERGHILKTFRKLLVLSQHEFSSSPANAISHKNEGKLELAKLGAMIFKEKSTGDSLGQFLQECTSAIRNRLTDLNGQGGWLGEDESNEEIEDMWRTDLVEEVVHILQIIFHQLQASTAIPSGALVISWLNLMAEFDFLETVKVPCEQPLEILLPLQSFVSLTTLAFLKLPLTIPSIMDRVPPQTIPTGKPAYFLCKDNISQINEILVGCCGNLATVNPVALSWGLILHTIREYAMSDKESRELEQFNSAVDSFQSNTQTRRSSRGSEPSQYEDLLEFARTPNYTVDEAITLLTCDEIKFSAFSAIFTLSTVAGSMSALDDSLTYQWVRLALLDLIRAALMYLDYPEVLEPVLAILAGSPDGPPSSTDSLGPASDPKSVFVGDNDLMHLIFRSARNRFPFEIIPFLKLCRALISEYSLNEDGLSWIFDELEKMDTFTQVIGPNFHGYETIREDENANYVSLTQSLPMFDSHHHRRLPQSDISNALVVRGTSEIPAATVGQVVSEQKPTVIQWEYRFSCLTFLGSWLEEWSESGGEFSSSLDVETVTEIIGLMADLVSSAKDCHRRSDSGNSAKRVLEMASDGLSRQGDIISILEPIMACLQFIQAVLKVLPGRVWPFFSRSSFIGSDGKGGILSTIISATEIPSGEYPFLLNCVNLLEALVDDAASRAVLRKSPGSVSGKSTIAVDWSASIPSHIMRTIVLNLTRTMVEIYNSNGNWRFNLPEQRLKINGKLANTFDRILYYAFGVNDSAKLELKVTGVFSSSATYLLDILRPRSTADLPFNPLLRLIAEGLETPPTRYLRYLSLIEKQVKSTLGLCVKLVQAARLLELSESLLEEQLFKATPVLVKLYALHDAYKLPVVSLLDILISSAASNPDNEPPSLVGYLGAESSCLFLDVLSQLNKPLSDRTLLLSVWQLLSTFVSKRQQWMAVFILTGSSPRQALKKSNKGKDPSMRGVPFLQMALERLSHIDQEEPQVALALLDFVSQAQEHWPWATPQLKSHPNFLNSIVNYVSKLKFSSLSVSDQIFTTRIAAVVADICAVYLHAAKEANDWGFVKTLIPLVQWYAKSAVVDVSAYNNSLHTNLKKNFEKRYTGCKIVDFKRTPLQQRILGHDYYYDLGLGEKMLSYDFAWAGTRGQGFSEEFERANINLSLVEAQVGLLNSWKYFAMEHCADFMPDREIQKSMALVAQQCLEANTRPVPAEAIFERIQQVRVDFAQALLQRLVQVESKGSEVFGLLEVTWNALRSRHATYEDALINDDTEYYRSLLNVLFLTLQFHIDGPTRATPAAQPPHAVSSDLEVVVEIVKVIVAQGFRSLTTYVHEQREKCQPKDFAIIIAILQTSLRVKNADRLYEHITYHIENNDTARQATTLFSWADKLLEDGDPVYGELSLSILVKLSTLPMLAEHLAVEAVLSNLSACKLTNMLAASKGCGPFQAPRLYTIWTAGFLPLCLNLLHNVIRAAPEVAAFLNQFEGQLDRASEAFSAAHAGRTVGPASNLITLSMASEAYSLSLISFIIDGFREAGASAGLDAQSIQPLKWDKAPFKEDIEGLVSRPANLRRRIAATTEKEMEWSRQKPVNKDSGAENRLEEKMLNELKGALACLSVGSI